MHRVGYSLLFIMLFAGLGENVAEAQLRFDADYLLWKLNNDSDSSIISGNGGFSAEDNNFGYTSGFQFTLGGSFDVFDVEASVMSVPSFRDSFGGTLTQPLVFDDPSNVNVAPANGLGFVSGLGIAARTPGLEDNEIEFLEPGAQFQAQHISRFDSFELNIGSNRVVRPVFFAVGWRHLELQERALTQILGNFQVRDADNGALPGAGGDEPNNQLSHAALTAAGFALTGGAADGFAGYDPTVVAPVITQLGIRYKGTASNDLDGGQLTVGGRYAASDIVSFQGTLKGGVYQNAIRASVQETVLGVVNDTSVYQRTFRDSGEWASFGGGLGLDTIIAVTDYVNFTLGYQALFLTNMAFGNDQTKGISTDLFGVARYTAVHDGLLVAHGANVGLTFLW